jgi:pyrimidine operon attenuation protein/uracil phosphoribosyltransferase
LQRRCKVCTRCSVHRRKERSATTDYQIVEKTPEVSGKQRPEKIDRQRRIVVVGGGTAGLTVAARIARAIKNLDIAIIEPSDNIIISRYGRWSAPASIPERSR